MKYLIAGLGNIGNEYANTRHNAGFLVADALVAEAGGKFAIERHAMLCEIKMKGRSVIVIKPTTYVNLSGKAVKYWLQKENIPIENLLVVVDDIALPTGALRLKAKGGDAGHNGLTDIIIKLNTDIFPRLRIGIGDNFAKGFQVEYVLGQWTSNEEEIMKPRLEVAVEMIKSFATRGIEKTMMDFNNK